MHVNTTNNGQRWAIADTHGCFYTFDALLRTIKLKPEDQLFLLGDYLDRKPLAYKIMDRIIGLQAMGYQIYPLRGNHEQNFLDACHEYDDRTLAFYVERIGKNDGLLQAGRPKKIYLDWLNALPFYYQTSDFIFVHAAVRPGPDFSDTEYMLNQYKVELTHSDLAGKTLLRGHHVTPLDEIREMIEQCHPFINLDNGCAFVKKHREPDVDDLGNLCAFNLDTRQLIAQQNIEPPSKPRKKIRFMPGM